MRKLVWALLFLAVSVFGATPFGTRAPYGGTARDVWTSDGPDTSTVWKFQALYTGKYARVNRSTLVAPTTWTYDAAGKYVWDDAASLLRLIPAGVMPPSCPVEPSSKNWFLRSQDFTNVDASWVCANTTVADSGVLGIAGHNYCTLTATNNNGTMLQTCTATAASWTTSFYIRRKTGTGAVSLTADGTNFTAVTVTSVWTRVSVTQTASAAAIAIGIKLATNADAVDIDCSQYELLAYSSSYIPTTTGAVSRAADALSWIDATTFGGVLGRGTALLAMQPARTADNTHFLMVSSGGGPAMNLYDGGGVYKVRGSGGFPASYATSTASFSVGSPASVAATWLSGAPVRLSLNGTTVITTVGNYTEYVSCNQITVGGYFGSIAPNGGDYYTSSVFNTPLSSTAIQSLTANPRGYKR